MRPWETLLLWNSKEKKCCLYKMPYIAAPIRVLGDVITNPTSYVQLPTEGPTRARISFSWFTSDMFCKRPTLSYWDFYVNLNTEVYKRRWYRKRTTYCVSWGVPQRVPNASLQADSALTCCHEQKPQEPREQDDCKKRDVEQSAPTHARHTHCPSKQLGTTADRRCDVSRDWLWKACHIARVHWGTRCEGFFSKEGPHYHIEQSARNQLECDQVQRAPEKLSRSCCQTSNNQPWFTSMEIPLGFLSQAVLHWLSGGLCHARKCQFKDLDKKKRYDSWSPNERLHKKSSEKGGMGKECRYYFWYQVPTSILLQENA